MRLRFFTYPAIAAVLVLSVLSRDVAAEPAAIGEYKVKAAFVYNFAKYVEWPPEAFPNDHSPLVVTILGTTPLSEAFDAIRGKTVKSRQLEIRQANRVEDVGASHILFVCDSERQHAAHIVESVGNKSILTISDMKNFAKTGGMISFVTIDDKIRFDINLGSARRSGLKISSQLLKLARTVID
jgi:hypothetical protein